MTVVTCILPKRKPAPKLAQPPLKARIVHAEDPARRIRGTYWRLNADGTQSEIIEETKP